MGCDRQGYPLGGCPRMPFFPNSSSCPIKLSSEYQLYACGNFFRHSSILEKIANLGQSPRELNWISKRKRVSSVEGSEIIWWCLRGKWVSPMLSGGYLHGRSLPRWATIFPNFLHNANCYIFVISKHRGDWRYQDTITTFGFHAESQNWMSFSDKKQ